MHKIKDRRKRLNLPKEAVAEYLSITVDEYSNFEVNPTDMSVDQIVGLMYLFDSNFEDLIILEAVSPYGELKRFDVDKLIYKQNLNHLKDEDGYITLYKYKEFNQYIMSEIFNNEIFMSYAKDLNDPLEATCVFTYDGETPIGYLNYNSVAIGSFSLVNDNPMMWALYSNNFEGLCYKIKVKVDEVLANNYLIGEVRYDAVKPMIKAKFGEKWPTDTPEVIDNLFFIKKIEWVTEKEVRIIYQPNYAIRYDSYEHLILTGGRVGKYENPLKFFKNFVFEEIIIGYQMNHMNKVKVISWAKQNNIKISYAYPDKYLRKIVTTKYE